MSDPTTELTSSDVDAIIKLVANDIAVTRSTMVGAEYTSITWTFSRDDDDDEPDVAVDDDLVYLQSMKQ